MSPSQLRPVFLIFALHLCSTCTALPLEQTPPRGEPINVPPGRSLLVSTRVCNLTSTNSFRYVVSYNDGDPDDQTVHMDNSLSYYEAENTGYAITGWRQSGSQCMEVAARIFNLPHLRHRSMTVEFILMENYYTRSNRTSRFYINLLSEEELSPTTLEEVSPTPITTHESSTVSETTSSWSPSSSLPTVSSIAVVSSSSTGIPGSVADAAILPPGATAAVAVSAAVAVGSVVCAVTVVAVALTRSRRHKKPANLEAGCQWSIMIRNNHANCGMKTYRDNHYEPFKSSSASVIFCSSLFFTLGPKSIIVLLWPTRSCMSCQSAGHTDHLFNCATLIFWVCASVFTVAYYIIMPCHPVAYLLILYNKPMVDKNFTAYLYSCTHFTY